METAWKEHLAKLDARDLVEQEQSRAFFEKMNAAQAIRVANLAARIHRQATRRFVTPLACLPIFGIVFAAALFTVKSPALHLTISLLAGAVAVILVGVWMVTIFRDLPLERRLADALVEFPDDIAANGLPAMMLDPQHAIGGGFKPRARVLNRLTPLLDRANPPHLSPESQRDLAAYVKQVGVVAHNYPVLGEALPVYIRYLGDVSGDPVVLDALEYIQRVTGVRNKGNLAEPLATAIASIRGRLPR